MRKFVCLTSLMALCCASCGNRNSNIFPVSGKVTCNGSPAAGATVFFYRQGGDTMNEHTIMGIVQDDGSFELACGSLGKGAPPGEYDVLVEWKQVVGQEKGRPRREPDNFQGRYADPKHPFLRATIAAQTNELPPFELAN